ncbi:cytoplasmic chaperone TorD family protein [Ectothiorhodospira sp. PHS-1]|uniref:TorD/DmsD family molecular chaperone n=1 Tax=Ectothiorhodospira sp. PHS-1 TaxID=519989 RepID=UPI00024A8910|nr:molecular chaperone TorD family protein [Ectothiorhodospira sp. PHS-1]EHQ52457.1 cytoplasmic chaperone TorD family protein [Ectothiorhodospira sp. PHS-1]
MYDASREIERATYYLCLSRAFAVPAPGTLSALRDALPRDLEAAAGVCGYAVQTPLAALGETLRGLDDQGLLVVYSRLFLMPGADHPSLNTASYLDGTIAGGSVHAMQSCYRRCGLDTGEDFHDLPDQISVQLEFVAWLLAARAEAEAGEGEPPPMTADEFLRHFVARWVTPLRRDIEQASRRFELPNHPYTALACLLEVAVQADMAGHVPESSVPCQGAEDVDPEIARLRAQYAGRRLSEADMAVIRERLAADGLPAEHVAIPVDERDQVMGLAAMCPPGLPGRRRSFSGR